MDKFRVKPGDRLSYELIERYGITQERFNELYGDWTHLGPIGSIQINYMIVEHENEQLRQRVEELETELNKKQQAAVDHRYVSGLDLY